MFSCRALLLATALLLLAGHASADGFTTGITRTRCNLDPSRAQVNNPCPSIYNAECDGNYCRCPRGQVEHPNLHKCVPGEEKNVVNDRDQFEDIPFDYVPPGQTTTQKPTQPYNASIDVSNTRCTAGNDPCPSLHSALCSHGYCVCPEGYMQDPNRAVCQRDNSPRPHGGSSNRDSHNDQNNHDDHEHHEHDSNDRDHDNGFRSTSTASNACVVSLVASLLVCALMGRH